MEIWPHKFDWKKFLASYHREGEDAPRGKWKALSLDHTDYDDSQATNAVFVDAFRLLRIRLPADISVPLGDFVAVIASVDLPDFPALPNETLPGEDLNREEEMGNIRSPATVRRVVDGLRKIDDARMMSALIDAWPALDKQVTKWMFYEPDRIADPAEFMDYLIGWRTALEEIAAGNYGMCICGG